MVNDTANNFVPHLEDVYIFANPGVQLTLIIIYSLVCCLCFFGNLVVILVIALHWKMRGSTKFCLANLAFANCCVGAFCIMQNLSLYLADNWIFGNFLCKMYHFINKLTHTASVLILVVITVERYFAILHPFKCRRILTIRRLRAVIVTVWILSALFCSPQMYYAKTSRNRLPSRKGQPKRYETICTLKSSVYTAGTADILQFVLLFILPIFIISILYCKVGVVLRRRETFVCSLIQSSSTTTSQLNSNGSSTGLRSRVSSVVENLKRKVLFSPLTQAENLDGILELELKRVRNSSGVDMGESSGERTIQSNPIQTVPEMMRRESSLSSNSLGRDRIRRRSSAGNLVQGSHKSVIRLLVVIVVTFALCNFPFHLRKIYQIFDFYDDSDSIWAQLATPLSFLLMYANCAINPIIYGFMSRSFRSCLVDCIKCRMRKTSTSR